MPGGEGKTQLMRCDLSRLQLAALALACLLSACSLKLMAVNMIGDALSGGGGVFESEEDPQLIREALPFGLKTYESLLQASPDHEGLLLASAKGFTGYAYLLQIEAARIDESDLAAARRQRDRAKRLFLRGRDFALRGLDLHHPDFLARYRTDRSVALAATGKEDIASLDWGGAAWAGALSAAKDDMSLVADLPLAAAMVRRVLELDENFSEGAAHEFFISYEGSRPGGSAKAAREHYRRALELSHGLRISAHLALAEAVTIRRQNLTEFRTLLALVNDFDLDKAPHQRLVNTIAKQRANWLESRIPELFLDAEPEGQSQ